MKTLLVCLVLGAATCLSLAGQEMRGFGHVYFAPARYSSLAAGAGGDIFIHRGAGLGIDAGYLWPSRAPRSGVGIASFNGVYHFAPRFERPDRDQKLVPFFTAGYGVGFRNGHANLFNWGGGVVWWFGESLGLRIEGRDYRYDGRAFSTQFRVGLALR